MQCCRHTSETDKTDLSLLSSDYLTDHWNEIRCFFYINAILISPFCFYCPDIINPSIGVNDHVMRWLPGMGVEIDTKKYSRNNEIESLHEFQFFGSTNVL